MHSQNPYFQSIANTYIEKLLKNSEKRKLIDRGKFDEIIMHLKAEISDNDPPIPDGLLKAIKDELQKISLPRQEIFKKNLETVIKLMKELNYPASQINLINEEQDVNILIQDGFWGETRALILACINNQIELVKALVECGAEVNLYNRDMTMTALLKSIQNNNFEMVKYLVENGANVNLPSKLFTPLGYAVYCENNSITQYLASHGAKAGNLYQLFKSSPITATDKDIEKIEALEKNSPGKW